MKGKDVKFSVVVHSSIHYVPLSFWFNHLYELSPIKEMLQNKIQTEMSKMFLTNTVKHH